MRITSLSQLHVGDVFVMPIYTGYSEGRPYRLRVTSITTTVVCVQVIDISNRNNLIFYVDDLRERKAYIKRLAICPKRITPS